MSRNPHYTPYTDHQLAFRRKIAEESAVEWPLLGGPSNYADRWTRSNQPTRIFIVKPEDQATPAPPAVRFPEILLGSVEPAQSDTKTKGRGKGRFIPLREVDESQKKRAVRRGRKKRTRERPVPAYWKPGTGGHNGGKSAITLWGYGLGMAID